MSLEHGPRAGNGKRTSVVAYQLWLEFVGPLGASHGEVGCAILPSLHGSGSPMSSARWVRQAPNLECSPFSVAKSGRGSGLNRSQLAALRVHRSQRAACRSSWNPMTGSKLRTDGTLPAVTKGCLMEVRGAQLSTHLGTKHHPFVTADLQFFGKMFLLQSHQEPRTSHKDHVRLRSTKGRGAPSKNNLTPQFHLTNRQPDPVPIHQSQPGGNAFVASSSSRALTKASQKRPKRFEK